MRDGFSPPPAAAVSKPDSEYRHQVIALALPADQRDETVTDDMHRRQNRVVVHIEYIGGDGADFHAHPEFLEAACGCGDLRQLTAVFHVDLVTRLGGEILHRFADEDDHEVGLDLLTLQPCMGALDYIEIEGGLFRAGEIQQKYSLALAQALQGGGIVIGRFRCRRPCQQQWEQQ